jgi:hypothetical protein
LGKRAELHQDQAGPYGHFEWVGQGLKVYSACEYKWHCYIQVKSEDVRD